MWFKTGLKILNYTQNNESLSKRSDFTVLSYNLLFYLTNSPARNKQNKPQKAVCARVCICLYVWFCWRAFVCSGKSGVWILSSCLSDRKAGSVKQSSRQHQSAICLISAVLHIPSNTEVHICLCAPGLYALTQCLLVYIPPTWSRHPFKVSNEIPLFSSAVLSLGYCSWQDRCIFTWKLLLLQLGFVSLLSC